MAAAAPVDTPQCRQRLSTTEATRLARIMMLDDDDEKGQQQQQISVVRVQRKAQGIDFKPLLIVDRQTSSVAVSALDGGAAADRISAAFASLEHQQPPSNDALQTLIAVVLETACTEDDRWTQRHATLRNVLADGV